MTALILNCILKRLRPFLTDKKSSPYNYTRNLLCEKTPYLLKFIKGELFPPFEIEVQMSSTCNLKCRWCIGQETQNRNLVKSLSNNLHSRIVDNPQRRMFKIENVVEGIKNFEIDGLKIKLVKFSGFIGEPLLYKDATMKTMKLLTSSGIMTGLFTNGTLMDKDTWPTLANISYVNISLDAGPKTFYKLKEAQEKPDSLKTFFKIIDNISGLDAERKKRKSNLNITISYVIVPENHDEIIDTAQRVKQAGADGIRFKCDIGDKYDLSLDKKILKETFEQLEEAMKLTDDRFMVNIIHNQDDITEKSFKNWNCKQGCLYQLFVGTVGSDGGLYLCDHNTMPGAIPFGNVINEDFAEVWNGEKRKYLIKGIPYTCQASVCPPFANAVNPFLNEIEKCKEEYGIEAVLEAVSQLKSECTA